MFVIAFLLGALSSEVIITNMQPSLTEITYTLSSSFDNYQHGSLIVSSSPEPHINQLQTSTSDAVVNTIATSLLSENVQPTLSNSSQGVLILYNIDITCIIYR